MRTTQTMIQQQWTSLFRLVAIDAGEEVQRKVKISIADIKASLKSDRNNLTEHSPSRFEQSDRPLTVPRKYWKHSLDVALTPNSPNFDRPQSWAISTWLGTTTRKGTSNWVSYTNMSKYVRVELAEAVENGSQNPSIPAIRFLRTS